MTITAATERDGPVSFSSETALHRAVADFVQNTPGGRMVLDARPHWDEVEDDTLLQEIDRHVVCRTPQQAWVEVRDLLDYGGHLEIQAPPQASVEADLDDEDTAE